MTRRRIPRRSIRMFHPGREGCGWCMFACYYSFGYLCTCLSPPCKLQFLVGIGCVVKPFPYRCHDGHNHQLYDARDRQQAQSSEVIFHKIWKSLLLCSTFHASGIIQSNQSHVRVHKLPMANLNLFQRFLSGWH
jgi:hypothetical protein